MKKIIKLTIAALPILVAMPFLASCIPSANGTSFIYSNFESYMNPQVEVILNDKYDVDFVTYSTNDQIITLLKNNEVEIATPSAYEAVLLIEEGYVQKLDWKKFKIPGVNNAEDAKKLYTLNTVTAMTSFKDKNGDPMNLLDYGVPYFAQDFVFSYRGAKIDALHQPNINWETTLDIISKESRFNANKQNSHQPLLWAIGDQRTLYSLSRSVQTDSVDLNPQPNASIADLTETYRYLVDSLSKMGNKNIQLKSDSNAVINALATKQAMGALLYNGDALYAAYGGDSRVEVREDDFHIVRPKNSLMAVEIVVIDNEVTDEKLAKAYSIIKEINFPPSPTLTVPTPDIENSLAYLNFDNVNYTPTNIEMYNYVMNNYFWTDKEINENGTIIPSFEEKWLKNILLIEEIKISQLEVPISKLVKSNLFFIYSTYFKENI